MSLSGIYFHTPRWTYQLIDLDALVPAHSHVGLGIFSRSLIPETIGFGELLFLVNYDVSYDSI